MTFADEGYEVFDSVLNPAEIGQLRRLVAEVCERFRAGDPAVVGPAVSLRDYTRSHPERNPGVAPEAVADEAYMLGNLAALDPRWLRLLATDALWALSGQLLDTPPSNVLYHFAQVIRKPARVGPALSWHRDYGNTYISTSGPYFVRLLIPLQAMSETNGGTGVVARSHLLRDADALPREGCPECGDGAVYPRLNAGDVLVLHSKTVHGGGTNRTELDRDLLAVQFGRRDATLIHSYESEFMTLSDRLAFLSS